MNQIHKNIMTPMLLALVLLSACSMAPPEEPKHQKMLDNQQLQLNGNNSLLIQEQWWTLFADPQLSRLIQLGLTDNLTLEQAKQRIMLASQQVALAESGSSPKLNLNAGAGVIGLNSGSLNAADADYSALGMLLPSLTYQFDFWGKNEDMVTAASDQKLSLQAQEAQAKSAVSACALLLLTII